MFDGIMKKQGRAAEAERSESINAGDGAGRAITIAEGDGIGPEIMAATLRVLEAAGAHLDIEQVEIGERCYRAGQSAGIAPEAWASLRRTKVFLKAPITTSIPGCRVSTKGW